MTAQKDPAGMLRISWYLPQTDCLGPGIRFALWVQGCPRRCEGCIASGLQDLTGGKLLPAAALASLIAETPDIEGITISGGEPFLQAQALGELLAQVRVARPALGVIVYTGYTREALGEIHGAHALLAQTDLLIDGEYLKALDDGKGMRGSANQRLHFLTGRYRMSDLPQERRSELRYAGGQMRMIGIPSEAARQMLSLLQG